MHSVHIVKYLFFIKIFRVRLFIALYIKREGTYFVIVKRGFCLLYFGKNAFYNTPKLKTISVQSKLFGTGKVVSAFKEAGMNRGAGLTVKTPRGYASTYEKLFVGEGKLNKKAVVKAA